MFPTVILTDKVLRKKEKKGKGCRTPFQFGELGFWMTTENLETFCGPPQDEPSHAEPVLFGH